MKETSSPEVWQNAPEIASLQSDPTKSSQNHTSQQQALMAVIARIRASLDLDIIFQTTATEVRQLLKTDRVGIFWFQPDSGWQGSLVAEDLGSGWQPMLDVTVHDHRFGEDFAPLYQKGRISVVPDIYEAGLSDCHIEFLEQFQIRANLVLPLLKGEELWGLLCINECRGPRHWTQSEIEFIQQIADHLSSALLQNELLVKAQRQAEQQKALTAVIARIRQSLDVETIFATTAAEVRQLLQVDRVGIFRFNADSGWAGELVSENMGSNWTSMLAVQIHDHCFGEQYAPLYQQGRISVIADVYNDGLSDCHIELLEQFQVRANIVAPLLKGEELWGLLCIHQCSAPRVWTDSEVEFVKQIASHLGVALQHTELLAKAQYQADYQKAFAGVVTRMQQSMDLADIFKMTVTEVRRLLQADRVAIFQFYPEQNWEGEIISEDVGKGWRSVLTERILDHCFSERFATQYQQGRIHGIADIYAEDFQACYVDLLETLQVRANLVAPLRKGEKLWGLLCIHQCSGPRNWEPSVIEFVGQIAEHLGIALRQARHLEKMQQQAAQLAQAAEQKKAASRQKTLAKTIDKIRQSLELDTIFETTTQEVRQLLEAERVVIYRFDTDWSGSFVAESMADGWTSLLKSQPELTDTCLQDTQGGNFRRNETSVVPDIYQAQFTACHVELLEQLEARAYIIAPIFQQNRLWGLLATYQNSEPRQWQQYEVELMTQIGIQLGIAIQQAEYLEQVQTQSQQLAEEAKRRKALTKTVDKIRRSLDINEIFETTTQEVRQLLDVDRVAIYQFNADWSGEFVADSIADGVATMTTSQPTFGHVRLNGGTTDLTHPRRETFVPILQGEKLWGLLVAYQNTQPRYWQEAEVKLLTQIGNQLGVALQQAEYLAQVRTQADKLARATKRERALAETVDKIRRSLDLATIFETTTQEVRQLLEAERIALFQFNADWSGQFVAESMEAGWTSLVETQPLWADTCLQAEQGGRFSHNETSVVADVYEANFSPCHLDQLEKIQARAYVIVPILQGEKLWGLLAAYQNSRSRHWRPHEVNLMAQIGTQLGIAIQQAELLEETRTQKEELATILEDLHQSQARLVQNEKMAGLGQLIAGVAHEINNPVSFISGNLVHHKRYIQDLLSLVELYREHYPEPDTAIQDHIEDIDLDFVTQDLPKILDSMEIGADRIHQLVLSLRNFSRHDHAEVKPVDIHEGIDSTLLILQHRLKPQGQFPGIKIVQSYGELPMVECYPAQLNQVFMNILSNGIDALEGAIEAGIWEGGEAASDHLNGYCPSPTMQIHTEWLQSDNTPLNDKVIIRISDNGPGMTETVKKHLFNPFFTTKEPGKGTGLGLSISYQIVVEKHGGQLKCASQLRRGSEFSIEIPIHQGAT